jgi:hypothetical protein
MLTFHLRVSVDGHQEGIMEMQDAVFLTTLVQVLNSAFDRAYPEQADDSKVVVSDS